MEMELSSLMTGGIQGDYSMLQSDSSAFQFSTELDMELSAPDAEVSAQIDPIDLELRGDLEEGCLLYTSGLTLPSFQAAVQHEVEKLPRVSGGGREADKVYVAQDVDLSLIHIWDTAVHIFFHYSAQKRLTVRR